MKYIIPEGYKPTKNQLGFLGEKFYLKSSTLKVVGVKQIIKDRGTVFIVECSVCSKDRELFPEIISVKNSLVRGQIPCGCSASPIWSKEQNIVRVTRECDALGFEFKGFIGEYNGVRSMIEVHNPTTNNTWSATLTGFLVNKCDPSLRGEKIKNALTREDSYHISDFEKANEDYYDFVRIPHKRSQWLYKCDICSCDEFVREGLCSGIFTGVSDTIKRGVKGCRCNSVYVYTQAQREYQLRKVMRHIGGKFLRWTYGSYKRYDSKLTWVCPCGEELSTQFSSFMKSQPCPCCSSSGFNPSKPAYFYVTRWYGYCESWLKFGITNQEEVLTRIKQQDTNSPHLDYEILHEKHFSLGQDALDIETFIKKQSTIEVGVCPKKYLPDGYSETVEDTPENLEFLMNLLR